MVAWALPLDSWYILYHRLLRHAKGSHDKFHTGTEDAAWHHQPLDGLLPPLYFDELYSQVRVLMQATTQIKLGFLDGYGRLTTACYALSMRLPQAVMLENLGFLASRSNLVCSPQRLMSHLSSPVSTIEMITLKREKVPGTNDLSHNFTHAQILQLRTYSLHATRSC